MKYKMTFAFTDKNHLLRTAAAIVDEKDEAAAQKKITELFEKTHQNFKITKIEKW